MTFAGMAGDHAGGGSGRGAGQGADDAGAARVVDALARGMERVRAEFDAALASELGPVAELVRHVERYRGKMLRPMLVLLSGMACASRAGADPEDPLTLLAPAHFRVAAVCEIVHMATLVHDDVLDEAEVRRRGATVNRLRGNEAAVILGDYLIAGAYTLCASLPTPESALLMGRACMSVCSGELLQLHHRGDFALDERTYFEIVARKTGDLIAAACELGALHAGVDAGTRASLARVGRDLGTAFQIQDDLLDLGGSEEVVGKSVHKDLEKGKLTLPVIHHLRTADAGTRASTLALLEEASGLGGGLGGGGVSEWGRDLRGAERPARAPDAARVEELSRRLGAAIRATGSVEAATRTARGLVEGALREIGGLPESGARRVLEGAARAVIDRAY